MMGARRQAPMPPPPPDVGDPPPDVGRVIVHFDIDAFYAQCEELRDPRLCQRPMGAAFLMRYAVCSFQVVDVWSLWPMPEPTSAHLLALRLLAGNHGWHRPLRCCDGAGVTQKYLIVTCNYPARACGVTKLMGIKEAQRRCPDIALVGTPEPSCLSMINLAMLVPSHAWQTLCCHHGKGGLCSTA